MAYLRNIGHLDRQIKLYIPLDSWQSVTFLGMRLARRQTSVNMGWSLGCNGYKGKSFLRCGLASGIHLVDLGAFPVLPSEWCSWIKEDKWFLWWRSIIGERSSDQLQIHQSCLGSVRKNDHKIFLELVINWTDFYFWS